jgi:plastocyanin
VAYADAQAKKVMVATSTAGVWTSQQVASSVAGSGLAMAVGKDGSVYLTYYTGDGSVQLATNKGGSWATSKVADAASASPTAAASASPAASGALPDAGNFVETTGVAVDDSGKIYVTYYDGAGDSIKVVSGDGATFAPISTTDTQGGRYPSIAVTPDGSLVYVAWYASSGQDLLMGVWGNQPSYAIGYLSPTPPPGPPPPPGGATCGADKKVALSEIAKGTAFQATCLVAAPGKAFSVSFDNQDPVASTGPHNMAFFSDSGYTKLVYRGALVSGPAKAVYPVAQTSGPLAAGTYYFHCEVHPPMQGILVVVAGAK